MAIGYTPQTWVNGSAPALSAANLQTMDNGINSACDAVDTLIINDGTDNPGASTGAKIVSALTKAGYSLDPATGSDNLDNIADGSSYKRILAAVATALNAGTYDAASVTAYGIGTTDPVYVGDLNTAKEGGIYRCTSSATNKPTATPGGSEISDYFTLLVVPLSRDWLQQVAFCMGAAGGPIGYIYTRNYYSGSTWGSWYPIWNALSDGNGGQPPAPKPKTDATTWLQGAVYHLASANNTQLDTPNPAGGSTWYVSNIAYQDVTTGVLSGISPSSFALILSGGAKIINAASGYYGVCDVWRIA